MFPASESGQSYLTIRYCIIRSAHDCIAQKANSSMETGDSLSENWNAVAFMLISITLGDGCRHWPISFTCSDTYHPVNLFSLFHEDSPCLTSTKVYLLRLDVSLLIAHATALLSLNPDLLRNILSDYAGDRSTMIATFLLLHQSFRIPCILMARSSTDIEIFEIWYPSKDCMMAGQNEKRFHFLYFRENWSKNPSSVVFFVKNLDFSTSFPRNLEMFTDLFLTVGYGTETEPNGSDANAKILRNHSYHQYIWPKGA